MRNMVIARQRSFRVPIVPAPARRDYLNSRSVTPTKVGDHANRPAKFTLKLCCLALEFLVREYFSYFRKFFVIS